MRVGRTVTALCVVSAVAAAIYFAFTYESPIYLAPTFTVIPLAWSILVLVRRYWLPPDPPDKTPAPGQVREAADWLAGAVHDSWRKEAVARQITTRAPISVRWRWAGDLSPREARSVPVPGACPPALPDADRTGPILASGVVTKLHDELYTRLPRGRLVITGGPGSGKTSAMILLLLEALAQREELAPETRLKVPVPVLLNLADWDPSSMSLSAWVASVLNRDYRALRSPHYGDDAASALIGSGRVALFLNGLDEMPEGLRVKALARLTTEAQGLRIVLTTRPEEYAKAARKAPLAGSAIIELCPVRPATAAKYLLDEPPAHYGAEWQKVADHIKENGDSAAARALNNPLWLAMAREAYIENDPTEILSFPTEDLVTVHLIEQFLARRYPRQRDRRWLGCLARHLDGLNGDGSRDLRWWRLGSMLSPAIRILAVTLATSVACTLLDLIISIPILLATRLPAYLASLTVPDRLVIALVDSLAVGPVAGLAFGLAYAIAVLYGKEFEPSPTSLRLRDPLTLARTLRLQRHAVRTASGFLGGLAGGTAYGIVQILVAELQYNIRIPDTEMLAIVTVTAIRFGLATGIPFFLVGALEEPSETGAAATPLSLLADSRKRILLQAAVITPLPTTILITGSRIFYGLVRGLPGAFWSLPLVIIDSVCIGVIGTICYIFAFTAWGQWLVMARVVLPLTGRLPWRLTGFLQDAYNRGVLRQAGAVYQFRHLALQAYLSKGSRSLSFRPAPGTARTCRRPGPAGAPSPGRGRSGT
ncbi:MAG: hypothetical protein J2P25_11425 [Nocardiopsaceae bacterium]|nr:hypothetical protein [Nocardiopsaceae bacterium]